MSTKEWRENNQDKLRAYRRKHYYENKEQYFMRNKKSKEEKKEFLNELKSVPCKDCGRFFPPYCMDFDHIDFNNKKTDVARLVSNSWKSINEEVSKCEVVCAICHRIREYKRRNGSLV